MSGSHRSCARFLQIALHQICTTCIFRPDAALDPTTMRRVWRVHQCRPVVSGQYARFGDQIRIDATLQDLKNDRRVPLKIDVPSEKEIPKAIDRTGRAIRQNLSFPTT